MSLNAQSRKALVDDYEGLLRVGRVTPSEWAELDAEEKACMLVAQRRIDLERALLQVQAMGGPDAITQLLAPFDNGDARVRLIVDMALLRCIQKVAS